MLVPIQSCYFHFFGSSLPLPKMTVAEKVAFVFLAFLAIASITSASALFISFNIKWAFFSLGISFCAVGSWAATSCGLHNRAIASEDVRSVVGQISHVKKMEVVEPIMKVQEKTAELIVESKKELPTASENPEESKNEALAEHITEVEPASFSLDLDDILTCHDPISFLEKSSFRSTEIDVIQSFSYDLLSQPEFSLLLKKVEEPNIDENYNLNGLLDRIKGDLIYEEIFKKIIETFKNEWDIRKIGIAFLLFQPYIFSFFEENIRKVHFQDLEDFFKGLVVKHVKAKNRAENYAFFLHHFFSVIEPFFHMIAKEDRSNTQFIYDSCYFLIFNFVSFLVNENLEDFKNGTKNRIEADIVFAREKMGILDEDRKKELEIVFSAINARQKKEREFGLIFLETYKSVALPFLSEMCASRNFSKETFSVYFSKILTTIKAADTMTPKDVPLFFNSVRSQISSFKMENADLMRVIPLFNRFFESTRDRISIFFEELKRKAAPQPKYTDFLEELECILKVFLSNMSSQFSEDPGVICAKSYLLSQAIWAHFKDRKSRLQGIDLVLDYMTQAIKKAGLNADILQAAKKLMPELLDQIEKMEESGMEAFRLIPLQDLILALNLIFFASHYAYELRPFIERHRAALFEFLSDLEIPEYKANEKKFQINFNIFLKILKPLNGALLGSWSGKSYVIKTTISAGIAFYSSSLTNEEKKWIDAAKPLILFVLLGIFGSKEREKNAFKCVEQDFAHFYKKIYSLEIAELIDNPEKIRDHFKLN